MASHMHNQPLPDKAKVEISTAVLASLITSGLLKVSECKCLDANAKAVLWQSLLTGSLLEEQAYG